MTTRLVGIVMRIPETYGGSDVGASDVISAEADDYDAALAELNAQVPDGHRLVSIRVDA